MLERNIVLTGFMGSGKTSVGREVARRLGRSFVDLDDLIEQQAGKPVTEIFARDGEEVFRALEAEACRKVSAPAGLVVAVNAHVADGADPAWLWDVPFEQLRGRRVIATGERCTDVAVRLRYADVDHLQVRDWRDALQRAQSVWSPSPLQNGR